MKKRDKNNDKSESSNDRSSLQLINNEKFALNDNQNGDDQKLFSGKKISCQNGDKSEIKVTSQLQTDPVNNKLNKSPKSSPPAAANSTRDCSLITASPKLHNRLKVDLYNGDEASAASGSRSNTVDQNRMMNNNETTITMIDYQ